MKCHTNSEISIIVKNRIKLPLPKITTKFPVKPKLLDKIRISPSFRCMSWDGKHPKFFAN